MLTKTQRYLSRAIHLYHYAESWKKRLPSGKNTFWKNTEKMWYRKSVGGLAYKETINCGRCFAGCFGKGSKTMNEKNRNALTWRIKNFLFEVKHGDKNSFHAEKAAAIAYVDALHDVGVIKGADWCELLCIFQNAEFDDLRKKMENGSLSDWEETAKDIVWWDYKKDEPSLD